MHHFWIISGIAILAGAIGIIAMLDGCKVRGKLRHLQNAESLDVGDKEPHLMEHSQDTPTHNRSQQEEGGLDT